MTHALYQMNLPERMITKEEVILNGEIIEDYPDDIRGHSCLMMDFGQQQTDNAFRFL